MTRRVIVRRILQIFAVYAALWFITATLGRHQVRAPILQAIRDTVTKGRPDLGSVEVQIPDYSPEPARVKAYYVIALAPCPFLVRIDRGYSIPPLRGGGEREWYLWLFGLKVRLARRTVWTPI